MNDQVLHTGWRTHELLLSLCVCEFQGLLPLLLWVLLFLVWAFLTHVCSSELSWRPSRMLSPCTFPLSCSLPCELQLRPLWVPGSISSNQGDCRVMWRCCCLDTPGGEMVKWGGVPFDSYLSNISPVLPGIWYRKLLYHIFYPGF